MYNTGIVLLFLHERLNLRHHSHTGRKLPHAHTSYHVIALVLILCGLVLGVSHYLSSKARAETLTVTAKISAPLPTQAANILAPANNAQLSANPVEISGTCQVANPAFLIKIFSNNQFIGSGTCSGAGTFLVVADLFSGQNTLVARTFNHTDDEGPASSAVTVTLTLVSPASTTQDPTGRTVTTGRSNVSTEGGESTGQPLRITTELSKIPFTLKKPFTFVFTVSGGTAPYALTIDWRDEVQLLSVNEPGEVRVTHSYNTTHSRTVIVRAADKNGAGATLQTVAVASRTFEIDFGAVETFSSAGFSRVNTYIWTVYTALSVAAFSFYAGERREQHILKEAATR